jgi:hypothetical protein
MPIVAGPEWAVPATEEAALALYLGSMPTNRVEAFWGRQYVLASPEHWTPVSVTPLAPSTW